MLKILILSGGLAALAGCSGRVGPHEVLVIKKTNTYHREGCPPTNMAKTTVMTASEARSEKFRPCSVCKPDSE